MQFSTSAALAAVAIFAGQSLAACRIGRPRGFNSFFSHPCPWVPSTNSWCCPTSGMCATRSGSTWNVSGGKNFGVIDVMCGSADHDVMMSCDRGSSGTFQFDCAPDQITVATYQQAS
ncbi:hypothetical protein E4U21_003578 [Claviceps maximensis]|nr:hypothetical protein E4U21_003578 [Claviceps maximensis]